MVRLFLKFEIILVNTFATAGLRNNTLVLEIIIGFRFCGSRFCRNLSISAQKHKYCLVCLVRG